MKMDNGDIRMVPQGDGETFAQEEKVGLLKRAGRGIRAHKKGLAVAAGITVMTVLGLVFLGKKGRDYAELGEGENDEPESEGEESEDDDSEE